MWRRGEVVEGEVEGEEDAVNMYCVIEFLKNTQFDKNWKIH